MKMCPLNLLLLAVVAGVTLADRPEDPLCESKGCPSDKPCRVLTECSLHGLCTLKAECLENPPKWSHTGVCQIGQPILNLRNGSWEDTRCYSSSPCPDGTYCNTELQDTYATCCRSDPTNAIKPGQCPTYRDPNPDTFFCVDTCQRDGDCRFDYKCCETGCRRECIPARNATACQNKKCPEGEYCLTPAEPECNNNGVCFSDGDCVSCPPICRMYCQNGFQRDSRGCHICKCKPRRKNYEVIQ